MTMLGILFFHFLLLGITLSSPVDTKPRGKNPNPEVTTHTPPKVNVVKNLNKEQTQSLNNAHTEKSLTKKRDIPVALTGKNEYSYDDIYEGRGTEDYDANQALRAYLDNSRSDSSVFDSGKNKVNDYRYYEQETRRKRTSTFDDIFDKSDTYREPEIHLTPEDVMILAAYRQQYRPHNNPYGHWTDINNSVEVPDTDEESDENYGRSENFFDRYYDQRYRNWENFPTNNKFILSRQKKDFMGNPKLRVPIYKRFIL